MHLVKLIVYNARRHEQDAAIAFSGGVATYKVLMGAISAAVQVIQTLRLPPAALVVLDIQSPVYHTAMMYALALCGVRSASVGTTAATERTGPRPTLFLTDRPELAATPDLPVRLVDPRWFAFDESRPIDYQALQSLPGFADPDEVFRYIYSSGTTGRPKCVGLTSRTLEHRAARSLFEMPQHATVGASLNTMGFSTVFGSMMPFMTHTHGGLLCFANGGAAALQMIRTFGVSYLAGSVAQMQSVVRALGNAPPPPSLRTIFPAGSATPRSLMVELRTRLASHVYGMYASTEMGRVTVLESGDMERSDGAAGYIAPGISVEIVDGANSPLPRGSEGVIRVQTAELAVYVDDAGNPVSMTDPDGWFYPGDVGRIEADGLLVVTGPTSEIINCGGVIVAPEAVEEVLRLDRAFSDLAVCGIPGPGGIDRIWAAVVSAGPVDEAAVIAASKLKLNERAPERIVVVDAIPRNENGKVMRNVLRDELLRRTRG